MAITIRNKETEAMIRRLGERWHEGPSAVVKRLAETELGREDTVSDAEYQRRMQIWDEIEKEFPPPTEEEKREMQHELDTMYDYLDDDEIASAEVRAAE
jgi:hypothetical protein